MSELQTTSSAADGDAPRETDRPTPADAGAQTQFSEQELPSRQETWETAHGDTPEYYTYEDIDAAYAEDGTDDPDLAHDDRFPTRQEAWDAARGDAPQYYTQDDIDNAYTEDQGALPEQHDTADTQSDTAASEATATDGADSASEDDASQESVVQDQDGDRPSDMDPADGHTEADEVPGRQEDSPVDSRPDITARYPADYVRSSEPSPDVEGPHEHPEAWAPGINPDKGGPGRRNNCGECSRAVDNTWAGQPATAAAMADRYAFGEPVSRMSEWAGTSPTPATMAEIGQRLGELGPGSSAVVGCDWDSGGGHWFNAVNDGGTVKAVDGQQARVEEWPPSMTGLRFDESRMRHSDAIFFTADGKVVKDDHA